MSLYSILHGPIVTEKTTAERMNNNKYSFYVDVRANKSQIKKAVENVFEVSVVGINTINIVPKTKRQGKFEGKTSKKKKAIVVLKEGDRIKLMEGP